MVAGDRFELPMHLAYETGVVTTLPAIKLNWSGIGESNSWHQFGKLRYCHYTNPAKMLVDALGFEPRMFTQRDQIYSLGQHTP